MKKYAIYIGILTIGLLLGWVIFGNSTNKEAEHNHNETVKSDQKWTCSMHPQIMKSEPGDCPICGMDLIPAETSADGLLADQFKLSENAIALANIQTSIVGNSNQKDNFIKLSGKIAENEKSNAVQVSYFSGRIEKLNVSFTGEKINKGQLLATIYSPELYAAQQELITAANLKETQPKLYDAVKNKLKIWKLNEKQISQIETSGKVIENFPVYATVSGTVSEKLVEQGDYIKQGQPLLKIAKLNTVWGNFDVYENQIKNFKKGQQVLVSTNAYANEEFNGKVDFIDPVLNTKTRTVVLRVVLNNKNNKFKPGMFVEAKIKNNTANNNNAISIPASAVLWTGKRSVVYIKPDTSKPVFEMKEIVLGKKSGDNYEVLEGLQNGDEIVSNGVFTIDAAAQLQGKKSMMNKIGGKVMTGHEGHLGMDNNSSKKETVHLNMNERLKVSAKFQKHLKVIYNEYINLKNALIKEDSKSSSTSALTLVNNLNKVDMKLLSDKKAHNHWMKLEREIKSSASSISETSAIKVQRDHFKYLSTHLMNAVQLFGINEKVYVEFCPMADNNKGAFWLSKEEKVINPYFGEAMLTCGEVKQVIE
ncbi:efflux RND transporter periplasmic adaptor subunit [Polaribacter ponticola]|uniref:Efflux RND transporter periplasmic adaptor subunit n=1 Tax=Polaribacter ponticola TaxID=2978475 RepID=A0ABT5S5F3_9FLAO|nr:efflux RND transporter periplasmic adaptor subunit [Polaribacter sp. MSW5]MDD7913325.1 efflux RND transporter periplasmic adaptor subunit [Polaribacter sp. MSW5]